MNSYTKMPVYLIGQEDEIDEFMGQIPYGYESGNTAYRKKVVVGEIEYELIDTTSFNLVSIYAMDFPSGSGSVGIETPLGFYQEHPFIIDYNEEAIQYIAKEKSIIFYMHADDDLKNKLNALKNPSTILIEIDNNFAFKKPAKAMDWLINMPIIEKKHRELLEKPVLDESFVEQVKSFQKGLQDKASIVSSLPKEVMHQISFFTLFGKPNSPIFKRLPLENPEQATEQTLNVVKQ